ncbi:hypothetical protein AAG570_009318 [Ranatra chinensis]|uniref:Coenzyme Q-binding protein COQ10 START domain-containing protein n=1 Tax=Ranatra chinensis TaxID=642074 RepID=A0ABD0YZN1_9HEMI
MEQMYNVVSDVENYRNFVPFCKKSNVTSRTLTDLRGELEIGFPPMVENYTSHVTLRKPHLVKAECVEGKMFKHLTTIWRFKRGLKDRPRSCLVDFYVSFEFKSLVHSQIANMFFNELVSQMESAFFTEAVRRYGEPSMKTMSLKKKN